MKKDLTVEKVRDARRKISEECNNDPLELVKYYREFQKKFSERLIKKPRISTLDIPSSIQ